MLYTLSKYTKLINHKTGDIILYNTYTCKQSFIFDPNIKKQLKNIVHTPQKESDIDKKLISSYCVPVGTDEDMLVFNKVNEIINNSEYLSLILFPTLECNLKCVYCYENKEQQYMSNQTFNNLFLAIKEYCVEKKIKYLKIEWFGGEPLLCVNKIIEFTTKVNCFCVENNIVFQHSMTTNGYLLSFDIVKKLLNCKITTYQITIDGISRTHDLLRPLKNGNGTWQKIIDNLIIMKKSNLYFTVLIRINYNYEVLDYIDEFLDFYKENFAKDERFKLVFKHIVPTNYHSFILDELLYICKEKGLLLKTNLDFSCGSELCYANKKNSFVIYINGDIGKCTLEERPNSDSDFVIGNINNGFFEIDKEKEKKWLIDKSYFYKYLKSNGCFECAAYPFCCATSCPAHRVKFGNDIKAKCTPTKNNLDNIVLLNYQISKG